MGVLDQFEPTLCAPLCMTSVMTLSVSLEMAYIILTDPHLAPAPGVGKVDPGLEPEPWGMPRAVAGLGQTLGAWRILHLAFLAFILGNVVGNLCLFIRRNPSIRGVFLANQAVGQGWSYCYVCESHVPQRCSHCHDCKVCVLRRDHHCVLFGQCVGHANHRFFLCCLLHMWLGLLYAISLNADIFLELLQEGLSLHSLFLLFIPWAMLITGQVGVATFTFAFVADTCILGFLFVSAFLLFHLQLVWHGQTTREWSAGLRGPYDLGWWQNLTELLGHRWYLTWICPLLPSPLPGNGIAFQIRPLPAHGPTNVY
ncbi:probable palmitoyltransferase ZDHHC24 isoform X1 [Pristis pectinata]|uniref:probable palmitoyltransferase ZDHHC24 isoform X1 n=1 Tax=Pristis pectinata TaxID=685728 RepID=UPI00223D88AE|nr:probable palmitoyltransferase ZDHHC24 isoform X1 [Pristis pectinata]